LPDIDWVEVVGGEFIYQKGPRRRVETFRTDRPFVLLGIIERLRFVKA
jgi:hypothetical protein